MPWGDNGNGNSKGPWGQGGQKPPGGGQRPPFEGGENLDQVIEEWQKKLKQMLPGGGPGGGKGEKKIFFTFAMVGLVLVLLADMFYIVEEGSRGVVMRFGSYSRTADPGPHLRLPTPIENVSVVQVDAIRTEEIGFRTSTARSEGRNRSSYEQSALLSESLMLTGDENIVDVNLDVQWNVKDAKDYLFNVRDSLGENTVKSAAESAIRDIIGESDYTFAIEGNGRAEITTKTQNLLREILDSYNMGVNITSIQIKQIDPPAQVIDTFRDVQTARADKEREINQAEAFSNDILPRAKGDAERLLREAEAYKQEVIAQAEGESQRFLSVYDKYRVAKDVTKRRMYLETMETVLEKVDKILIDNSVGGGVVPYLPLNQLKK